MQIRSRCNVAIPASVAGGEADSAGGKCSTEVLGKDRQRVVVNTKDVLNTNDVRNSARTGTLR